MSDERDDGGTTDPGPGHDHEAAPAPDASFPPPPPPPASGPASSSLPPVELTLQDETSVQRSSGIGARTIAAIAGVVVLLAGTVFALTQVGGGGANSAEDAVDAMLDAIGAEDVLGMMAALDPGEREAMRGPIEDMFDEFERLEIVDDSFELTGIAGIDFEFSDVTYRTDEVRDGLARVHFTGGTVTSSIDSAELPIGSFVTDTVERFGGEIDFQESETTAMDEGDAFLVARRGDDGWHVSLGYTIAEAARLDADAPFPATGAVTPVGADSPEAAVEGMVRAAFALDLREMIGRLSPGEFGALQEYAGMFLPGAETAVATAQSEFDLTLDDIGLRSETDGNRASVFVDDFALTLTVEGKTFSVAYAEQCVTLSGDLDQLDPELDEFLDEAGLSLDGPLCLDDFEEMQREAMATGGFEGIDFPDFPELAAPKVGITTTRHDGQWYVAPIATSLDGWVAVLEVLDREALDAIVDFVEEAMNAFIGGFAEAFSGGSGFGGDFDTDFDDPFGEGGVEFEFGEVGESPLGDDVFATIDFQGLVELLDIQFPDDFETQDCFFFAFTDADPELVNQIVDAYPDEPQDPDAAALLEAVARDCLG